MLSFLAKIPRTPKTYWLLGGIVILLIGLIAVITLSSSWVNQEISFFRKQPSVATTTAQNPGENVGKEGAVCSGPELYPCAPGTVCSVPIDKWGEEYGTCILQAAESKPTIPAE